jgi:ubiquinone/menaquinone biosynthesis C-methylase UbiE
MSSDSRSVGRVYDSAAKYYDRWAWQTLWRENEKPLIEKALSADGVVPIGLDLGVGTGAYINLLRRYCKNVIGVDISIGMLDTLLQKHPNASCVCAQAEAIPLRSSSCQQVLATRVLSHLVDLTTFFAETARVLAPGGAVIVSDLDPEHKYQAINFPGQDPSSIRLVPHNHSLDELQVSAQAAGLTLERSWRLSFSELRWKPPHDDLLSLDRSTARHLFYVAVFRYT